MSVPHALEGIVRDNIPVYVYVLKSVCVCECMCMCMSVRVCEYVNIMYIHTACRSMWVCACVYGLDNVCEKKRKMD